MSSALQSYRIQREYTRQILYRRNHLAFLKVPLMHERFSYMPILPQFVKMQNNWSIFGTNNIANFERRKVVEEKYEFPLMPDILLNYYVQFYSLHFTIQGTAVAQWLRCCATNQKVASSILAGDTGIFHFYKILPIALWTWGRPSL